jgi:hypothetical protein
MPRLMEQLAGEIVVVAFDVEGTLDDLAPFRNPMTSGSNVIVKANPSRKAETRANAPRRSMPVGTQTAAPIMRRSGQPRLADGQLKSQHVTIWPRSSTWTGQFRAQSYRRSSLE